jgi:hypothetical protein
MPGRKKPRRGAAQRKGLGVGAKVVAPRSPAGSKAKRTAVEEALGDLTSFLERCGAPGFIIGGIAVIAWGFGRSTLDIDAAVAVAPSESGSLLLRLRRAGFVARIPDARAFAEENLVILVRHARTGFDVDISLAQLDFEKEALGHLQHRPFGCVQIPVPRPTDLIVYKMIAARPRDLQDVEELLARGLAVDEPRVVKLLREFDSLLETDRAAEWRRLRARLQPTRRGLNRSVGSRAPRRRS